MKKLPLSIIITILLLTGCQGSKEVFHIIKESNADDSVTTSTVTETEKEIPHISLPEEVRGIYWTSVTAGSQTRSDALLAYMEKTNLNTVVIDLKIDNGAIAFTPTTESLLPYVQKKPSIKDLDGLLQKLYEKNIYRIARLTVMHDDALGFAKPSIALKRPNGKLWTDKIGSVWLDPDAHEVTDTALALADEAYSRGFDEIQFDYVRFPSDGSIKSIVYPVYNAKNETRTQVMQRFFNTIHTHLSEKSIPHSFDVFGMTFWSTNDYGIGQRLIDVFPLADFVSPMPYPSHYPNGFEGYTNPALYPYEIVKKTLDKGAAMIEKELGVPQDISRKKIRPWIQDFDIGAIYTPARIEAQIRAARDAGASGWILWNARNVYEPSDYINTSHYTPRQTNEAVSKKIE